MNIKNIKINKEKNQNNSSSELLDLTNNAIWLERLFKEINIENISYKDVYIKLLYKDNIFYIDTPYLTINMKIKNKDRNIEALVNEIKFKDFNLTMSGELQADLKKEKYDFNGTFSSYEIGGNINLNLDKDMLNYQITDAKAKSIKNFINNLAEKTKLNNEIKHWIYGYIVADEYNISVFKGRVNLKTFNIYPNEAYGSGFAKNLVVKFNPEVAPATASFAKVEFKKDSLFFTITKPRYYNKSIDGTRVEINNLVGKNANILISIKTNSILDEKIHEILKAYGVDFPITQNSGSLDSKLDLRVFFEPFLVHSKGEFILNDANISIGKNDFYSKHANIFLKDNNITLKDAGLEDQILNAKVDGTIDMNTNNGKILASFEKIYVGNGEIVNIKDLNETFYIDYSNGVLLTLPDLSFKMNIDNTTTISIDNLNLVKQYSDVMKQFGVNSGKVFIYTNDFSKFKAELRDINFDLPLFQSDGSQYDNDDFDIIFDKNLTLSSKSNNIKLSSDDNTVNIWLNNLKLLVDDKISENTNDKNLIFYGYKTGIILKDFNKTINFDNFKGSILKNGKLSFNGNLNQGKIELVKTDKSIQLNANNLNSDFINMLTEKNTFEGGNFNVKLTGADFKNFKSEIKVHKTHLIEYKFYQQFLSFLDSIPSLIIFKAPDLNNKGFTITKGVALVNRDNDVLTVKALNLTGSSADIAGTGDINIENGNLNLDFELRLLKDASSIINKIPIVNYIILGKDHRLSTVIKVRGTLNDPKFKTQVVTDILKTPFHLIKNTLGLPLNFIKSLE